MDLFDLLTFIGGISLFLFGMNIMSKALEKRAGSKLKTIVSKMTSNKFLGLVTGALVTVIIQSSSATTVMVVGFVNSGIMNLGQAIGVIMGANIGTTITSWILSLAGISSTNTFIRLLKPQAFSSLIALIGIVFYMFFKSEKKKDTGMILLGFATLMFGMETMSTSVSGLKNVEWFRNLFISFENSPLLGVLMGVMVTALIQSSSASIGILQAFAITGQISYGAAIPIILGQNIGTCITAIISSLGTNENAKRSSLVHLLFNVVGTGVALSVYMIIWKFVNPILLSSPASLMGIALVHSGFNIACTVLLFPFSRFLEKIVCKIVPNKKTDIICEIDERLMATPSIALSQVKTKVDEMSYATEKALDASLNIFGDKFDYETIVEFENKTDYFEDLIGSYIVKLSTKELNADDSKSANLYLKIIGDLERIADHSLNIAKINKEMEDKGIALSEAAKKELGLSIDAIREIWGFTSLALLNEDVNVAFNVEPLEQAIDLVVKTIRNNHIIRIQNEECTIDKGFILADLLSNVERIADHCSNIAGYIIDGSINNLNSHENITAYRHNENYKELYDAYRKKYSLS